MTAIRNRSRWMGFTTPAPEPTPTRAAPALSVRDAAIVDEFDELMSRVPRPPVGAFIGLMQSYINLSRTAVAAHRAARG